MVASLKSLTAAQTIRILIQTHNGRWPMELDGGTNRKQIHTTEYVMPY